MKVYFDCAYMRTDDYAEVLRFLKECDRFLASLRSIGCEILNYESKDLPFDPYESEISDFVEVADAVVTLAVHPSTGFSTVALIASEKKGVPRFKFIPGCHDVTLRVKGETISTFASTEYVAEVLGCGA